MTQTRACALARCASTRAAGDGRRRPGLPLVLVSLAAALVAACDGGADAADAEAPTAEADVERDAATSRDGVSELAGEVEGPAATPLFVERSAAAGLTFERALPDGYDDLVARLGGGACVLDVDGAPPLDLFATGRGGSARLFVGAEPWRWADETAARGLAVDDALGCLAVDVEGDGDTDLVVAGVGRIGLWRNDDGRFVDASERLDVEVAPTAVMTSIAAGDLDLDGDLDLVVAGFVDVAERPSGDCGGLPCAVLVRALPGVPNVVLMNDGGRWSALPDAGPLHAPEPTLVVGVVDVDGDGRPEVVVGNDMGDNVADRLVSFATTPPTDLATDLGFARDDAGHGVDTMGWSLGDVTGDGVMDHAKTAFDGRHSPLVVCPAPGERCADRGRALGTAAAATELRWGNGLADFDLDGDVDLFEACGHVFTDEEGDAIGFAYAHEAPPHLFLNDLADVGAGGAQLVRVEPDPTAGDGLAVALAGRGTALADLDDDGRVDVVVADARGGIVVLHNQLPLDPGRAWVRVALEGAGANADGVGAVVRVTDAERTQTDVRIAGEGFLGSFDPRLVFGVAGEGGVAVEVRWPSGAVTHVDDVERGTTTVVRE